jgi:hypothetical protein
VIKVGDRIGVRGWKIPVVVSRIFYEDATGNEIPRAQSVSTMLELDWGEHGKSKVALHDEGDTWYHYTSSN